jgi:hypothetical protein
VFESVTHLSVKTPHHCTKVLFSLLWLDLPPFGYSLTGRQGHAAQDRVTRPCVMDNAIITLIGTPYSYLQRDLPNTCYEHNM